MLSRSSSAMQNAAELSANQSVLVKDSTIAYLVREAHRSFARDLQSRIERHGVNVGMWRFLRVLWEEDGISQRELSERVGMAAPTTALAMNRMEKQSLIVRVRSNDDRRIVDIRLTKKGKALRNKLLPYAAEANAIACAGLSQQEIQLLRRMLITISANLRTL